MKFEHTDDVNLKIHPVSRVYYYVRGAASKSLRTTDFKEAVARKKIIEAERDFSGAKALKLKVSTILPEYLKEKQKQRDGLLPKKKVISHGTYDEIEDLFRLHLTPYFGKMTLAQVTTSAWNKYCDRSKVSDLANHRKVMQGFLKWCKAKEFLMGLPDITAIPSHDRRQRRIVKPDELRAIFKHCSGSLKTFLALALYNGLRRTEIMTLAWARIDLENRFLAVEKRFNKKRRGRSIPINQIVINVLREHRTRQVDAGIRSPWVFPNAKNPKKPADVSGLKTAWRTCLRRAFQPTQPDITWHDFRATFEKYAHKSLVHTDTQKEKFADASMDVQKKIYVSMEHEDLQGLESVVEVPGLPQIISGAKQGMGKQRESE
jgi:integrase